MGGLGGTPPIRTKKNGSTVPHSLEYVFIYLLFLNQNGGFGGYPPNKNKNKKKTQQKKMDLQLFQFLMLFFKFIFYLFPISGNTTNKCLKKKKKKEKGHTLPLWTNVEETSILHNETTKLTKSWYINIYSNTN